MSLATASRMNKSNVTTKPNAETQNAMNPTESAKCSVRATSFELFGGLSAVKPIPQSPNEIPTLTARKVAIFEKGMRSMRGFLVFLRLGGQTFAVVVTLACDVEATFSLAIGRRCSKHL